MNNDFVIIWSVAAGVFGAGCGSFVGAMVWRMKRNRDLDEKVEAGKMTKKTADKQKLSWINGRSICESCEHKLGALDMIPIFSWLFLRGKCRHCGAKIGATPILLEIFMTGTFVTSFLFWPFEWSVITTVLFAVWLLIVVIMAALFVYDARWHLLPDRLILPLVILAVIFTVINNLFINNMNVGEFATATFYGLLPITGVYGALWAVSRGKWVGLGDVKLGVAIGLLVGWGGALVVLVAANCLGTLTMIPMLMRKKVKMNSQIAFGPFLIIATFIVVLFGGIIMEFLQKELFLF